MAVCGVVPVVAIVPVLLPGACYTGTMGEPLMLRRLPGAVVAYLVGHKELYTGLSVIAHLSSLEP